MAIRERLDQLSRAELAGLIVVVVLTLAGAGLWYLRSLPKPVEIAAGGVVGVPVEGSGAVVAGVAASPTASPVPIIVDITGSVLQPGVYEFVQGDRVIDAVERAGGAKPNADLTTLNLAALLTDGTQIVVPKQGAAGAVGATGSVDGSASAGGIVNINTATATEFETLSGIGEVLAAAIVDYRIDNGPFTSVDELEDVSGIGPSTLEEIRDQVTV